MNVQKVKSETLEEKIAKVCEEIGCRLYYLRRNVSSLQIFIDKPESVVGLSDCEKVSKKLKIFLPQEGLSSSIDLEVSSPGVEKILVYPWHFSEVVGQMIRLQTVSDEGKNNFCGLLSSANDQGVVLKSESQSCSFAFKNIEKASVVFQYSKNKQVHST